MNRARVRIARWLSRQEGWPRIADVEVTERTSRGVYVSGHGAVETPVHCLRCGLTLTHPVSQTLGIGPICCGKLGIPWTADTSEEALAELREALIRETTFEGWLPISQVEFEWQEGSLEDVPEREAPESSVNLAGLPEGATGRIRVSEWIAEKKPIRCTVLTRVTVKRTTEKALLILIEEADFASCTDFTDEEIEKMDLGPQKLTTKHEVWYPFSQIEDAEFEAPAPPKPRKPGRWKATWRDVETGEETALNSERSGLTPETPDGLPEPVTQDGRIGGADLPF